MIICVVLSDRYFNLFFLFVVDDVIGSAIEDIVGKLEELWLPHVSGDCTLHIP